jgi:enamine deaminase RidA (YjgF/YER057c/UK114 family)
MNRDADADAHDPIEDRLARLGTRLPDAAKPVGSYLPVVISGNIAFVSGQITTESGQVKFKGKVGREVSIESGQQAAKLCTINALAQLKSALGTLEKIERFVKITGFVNCDPSFTDQAKVMNGASDFLVQLFGENGRHARSSVGVSSLPLDSSVEVEFIVKIRDKTAAL